MVSEEFMDEIIESENEQRDIDMLEAVVKSKDAEAASLKVMLEELKKQLKIAKEKEAEYLRVYGGVVHDEVDPNIPPDNKIMDYVVGLEQNLLKVKEENEKLKDELKTCGTLCNKVIDLGNEITALKSDARMAELNRQSLWADSLKMKDEVLKVNSDLMIVRHKLEGQRDINDRQYAEKEQLKSNLKIAVEALEFYAADINWNSTGHFINSRIDSTDMGSVEPFNGSYQFGGKKARQALSKIGEL